MKYSFMCYPINWRL